MTGPILFVDDEPDLRFIITNYFESCGWQVLAAGDAAEAIRLSAGVPLAAVILDVNLPGAGSGSLLEALKKSHPAAPIILYTGRPEEDSTVKEMLARGARLYLFKDGSLEALLTTVKGLCGCT